ncbi:MAG: ARMT1-like domain-containing protein [Phycisphaerae bacterium]|nr:ARMT1-like domain-containing protein [Phycisphaerae bacterium]
MRTHFDCIPCIIRQALDAVRLINNDEKIHEQILREVLCSAGKMNLSASPPAMAQKTHRIIRQLAETDDPYKLPKQRFNEFALKLFPKFQDLVSSSVKSFEVAVRLAIAGNIIDLGAKCSLGLSEAEKIIEQTMTEPFDMKDFKAFQDATDRAEDILYLADNAGEIVFDRPLLEQIGPSKITFVVKGAPVINDATIDDAEEALITNLVEVIDNGDDAPGTILKSCSHEFQQRFEEADLIIAKGQGNYETLSDVDKDIFFILRAKCSVIAGDLNCPVGTLVLRKNRVPKIRQLTQERG